MQTLTPKTAELIVATMTDAIATIDNLCGSVVMPIEKVTAAAHASGRLTYWRDYLTVAPVEVEPAQ